MTKIRAHLLRFLLSISCVLCFHASAQSDPAEEAKNLIVMIEGERQEMEVFGAGIAVSVARGRLYIATADHVVRRGDEEAETLRAQFWQLPGESFELTLLDPLDTTLDLAVLSIRLDELGLTEADFPFALLSSADTDEVDSIFTVGQGSGRGWATLVEDINVLDAQGGILEVQSTTVTQGDSGGGVFAETGELLGMIVQDQPPALEAISTATMLETLAANRYPVMAVNQEEISASKPGIAQDETEQEPTSADVPGTTLEVDGLRASSTYSSRYSEYRALDGDTETFWKSDNGDVAGSSITLLFREPKTIARLRMYFQARPEDAQPSSVTLSNSAGESRQVTFRGLDGWEEASFEPITADTFALTLNEFFASSDQRYANIYEVEFFSP